MLHHEIVVEHNVNYFLGCLLQGIQLGMQSILTDFLIFIATFTVLVVGSYGLSYPRYSVMIVVKYLKSLP